MDKQTAVEELIHTLVPPGTCVVACLDRPSKPSSHDEKLGLRLVLLLLRMICMVANEGVKLR